MAYAVIAVGGKQYVVHEGERLLVDRLAQDEGAVFQPDVLLVDAGVPNLKPGAGAVSARVLKHALGEKIRIGKYKPKKGYRRHNGFRAQLSQIQIEAIGAGSAPRAAKAETIATPPAELKAAKPVVVAPEAETKVLAKSAAKPAAKPAAKAITVKKAATKPAATKPAATKASAKAKVGTAKKPAAKRAAPRKKAES